MSKDRDVVIAGINGALNDAISKGVAEFSIGSTKVKIDQRGLSIVLNEEGLDPFALRIHRPGVDVSCWGYILAGEPGMSLEDVIPSESVGFHVVASLPAKA